MAIQASRPDVGEAELRYVTEAVRSGWLTAAGPFVKRFESEFAAYTGQEHGVTCASGTAALHLALRALGVGPGDEVIVPEFTFVASAWAVTYLGATPVFVDVKDDLLIDPGLVEAAITERTKVIMPVHVHGRRCDMAAIMRLAFDYGLRVVEDSAEAHGIPVVGDIGCFSLYANKIITAGEGGICVTSDRWLAEQMKHLRGMAIGPAHDFMHKKLAYTYRMTNLQAAVALGQFERIEEFLAQRAAIADHYDKGLADIAEITPMPARDVLWMYDLRAARREELRAFLADAEIETRPFFPPMSRQPMYLDPSWPELNAARLAADGLCLPTYNGMTRAEQDHVIEHVRRFHGA
ncbi:DegT/DnrJ/EryC1/StrS family aminotransferase [Actinokineospora guangxiensis]|uniref:DegT/DnrJ/EryC1/StrS family aminotransferase n=1 Tax=Actinokineospora guangxiensis TaxID=1490288 RepID=A0ABW0ESJ5_9PSEU